MPIGSKVKEIFRIKTVYFRMVIIFIAVMIVVTLTLGLLLGALFQRQYYDDQIREMQREARILNEIINERYIDSDKRKSALEEINLIARKYNAYIRVIYSGDLELFSVNPNDSIQSATQERSVVDSEWEIYEPFQPKESEKSKYKKLLKDVFEGEEKYSSGNFFGFFKDDVYTYAGPWTSNDKVVGAIFFHTKMDESNKSIFKIYVNVFNSSLLALSMAFILVSITARQFTNPLVEMNIVAKSYAKGDFSKGVRVKTADEIGQLSNSFNQMAKELMGIENMRKSFVANVSHELKAPLSSMQGFVQAVLDGSVPREDQNEYLAIVLEETKRLNNLINDLLDISKMESGKIPLNVATFDINELIRLILITFETKIDERKLVIHVKFNYESVFVNADKDKISQVIRNLIDNAIKYSYVGTELTIISFASTEKGKVFITVKDAGYGIPEEDLPHIFERFYKVDKAHTPGSDGTGLGLSIVRFIIEQHKAQIHIVSKLNKGTSICFWLPLSKQPKNVNLD